jgi:hypothetical protein
MSLILSKSKIDTKAFSGFAGRGFMDNKIRVGEHEINIEDFAELVMYFMTNTDLAEGDIRLSLQERIAQLHPVEGWNGINERLSP